MSNKKNASTGKKYVKEEKEDDNLQEFSTLFTTAQTLGPTALFCNCNSTEL